MEKLKNLFLYLSAFVPMYILILIKLIIELISKSLVFNMLYILYLITLLILIGSGVFGLISNIYFSHISSKEIVILEKKNITDKHFFGYFSLFVLFALQLNLKLISSYILFILILTFIGIVYIKNSLYYINPCLNILGYNFYDIIYSEINAKEKIQAKIFYKGELKENNTYKVVFKNQHFSFINKK